MWTMEAMLLRVQCKLLIVIGVPNQFRLNPDFRCLRGVLLRFGASDHVRKLDGKNHSVHGSFQ